jgi:hypothetical protein
MYDKTFAQQVGRIADAQTQGEEKDASPDQSSRRVIHRQSSFQHHLLKLSIPSWIAHIPLHVYENDLDPEMTPFERVLLSHKDSLCSFPSTLAEQFTSCNTTHRRSWSARCKLAKGNTMRRPSQLVGVLS